MRAGQEPGGREQRGLGGLEGGGAHKARLPSWSFIRRSKSTAV